MAAFKNRAIKLAYVLASAACLSACASSPAPREAAVQPPPPTPAAQAAAQPKAEARPASISAESLGLYRDPADARKPPTDDELLVIASAKTLIGQLPNAKVVVKGKQFTLDCIGTVSAIFYRMDIDVTKDFDKYSGNGVNRLYMTLKDLKVLHRDRYPRTGDVIIWDNTWDANGDGDRTNDLNTHAGIVLAVDDDGTIHYVHENLYKGVMIEVMNLLQPSLASDDGGKRLNSGLAIATVAGGAKPERWLSGDVFKAFGDVLRIKGDLKVAASRPGDADPNAVAATR
jgi:hypothetical protein